MANHCYNYITLSWKKKSLLQFLKDYNLENFSVKWTDNMLDIRKPFKKDELYDRELHWIDPKIVPAPGSRWCEIHDLNEDSLHNTENKMWTIWISTTSAWSPPDNWAIRTSKEYWIFIKIEAEEEWVWFEYELHCNNWDVVFEQTSEYRYMCQDCEKVRWEWVVLYNEDEWSIRLCDTCHSDRWSVCCWASLIWPANDICLDCKEHSWLLEERE